jgi:Flp pilus assembly protein TadG
MATRNKRFCSNGRAKAGGASSSANGRIIVRHWRSIRGEEGSSLVEITLVCTFIYLPMLFGIIQVSIALYSYNFICDAARHATRYASVRGVESCTISSTFPDCNLSPTSGANPTSTDGSASLQTYVRNMGYPGIDPSKLTATATWWSANVTNPADGTYSYTDWNTQCTSTDLNGNACNTPGNAVKVVVNYSYTMGIPFVKNFTMNLSSTSQMVINE